MNNLQNECCKYREKLRSKVIAKRKKKTAISKLNEKENFSKKERNFQSTSKKCSQKEFKKTTNLRASNYESETKDWLSDIKPSITDRQKYNSPQHLVCFLEGMRGKIENFRQKKKKKNEVEYADWCGSLTEKKLSKSTDLKCDSFCSFDSVIDLKEMTLTLKEMKEIEASRLNKSESRSKKLNDEKMKEDQDNKQLEKEESTETNVPDDTDNKGP